MDELEIQHSLPGRDASPCFEATVRAAVEAAFKSLFETKNLYQKVEVDISTLGNALKRDQVSVTEPELVELQREARLRPWSVSTHHQGDDPSTAEVTRYASLGCDPIDTPVEEMSLNFLVPGVRLNCKVCKDKATFEALTCSRQSGFASPFPRTVDDKTEQMFMFFHRCVSCREFVHTTLTYRQGLRIHFCGIAPRRQLAARIQLPRRLQPIADDAHNAALEGDVFAGFYHLRTLIEHYIKHRLSISIEEQLRGDELTDRYNASLPEALKAAVPSLAPAYEELSQHLHSRTGGAVDFSRLEAAINDHMEALKTLERYHPKDG